MGTLKDIKKFRRLKFVHLNGLFQSSESQKEKQTQKSQINFQNFYVMDDVVV